MRADLDGLLIGVQDTLGPLFPPPDDHVPGVPGSGRIKDALVWPSFRQHIIVMACQK